MHVTDASSTAVARLESESRMAAQRVFQHAGWVTRDLGPDYGLDQHVEVFDEGVATGLFFFTQVKATDEPDLQRALAVSFTASNLGYFEAVDDPVLLLRFHAPTQTLFGRWFHRLDDRSSEAATSTVRFSPNGVVDEESLAALQNEVVLFRTLRDAIVRWPLVVRVSSTNPPVLADDVVVACAAAAGRQRYVKYVTAGPSDKYAEAAVTITDDHVVVHLGGGECHSSRSASTARVRRTGSRPCLFDRSLPIGGGPLRTGRTPIASDGREGCRRGRAGDTHADRCVTSSRRAHR